LQPSGNPPESQRRTGSHGPDHSEADHAIQQGWRHTRFAAANNRQAQPQRETGDAPFHRGRAGLSTPKPTASAEAVLEPEIGHSREHGERDHKPDESGRRWPVRSRQRDSRQEEEQPTRADRGDSGFSAVPPVSYVDVSNPAVNRRPRHQHDRRPPRLTVRVCGLAAVLTLVLSLTIVPSWRGSDVPVIVFALTPYLVLGALATVRRGSSRWGWSLFGLTVVLSLVGVGCFAVDSWMFHTVAEYRMVQRFTVIVVPLLQLAIVAPIVLIDLL